MNLAAWVSVGGLHRSHSAVIQNRWASQRCGGEQMEPGSAWSSGVYIYLCSSTTDVWMVVMDVGYGFFCVKSQCCGVFSYCWFLAVQSDVLRDNSGWLGQCIFHSMTRGSCTNLLSWVRGQLTMWDLKWYAVLLIGFRKINMSCVFSTLEIWSVVPLCCMCFFLPVFVVGGFGLGLLMWESGH